MREWKTKAVLPNLESKGQQGYLNSNVSPCIGYISEEAVCPGEVSPSTPIVITSEYNPQPLGAQDTFRRKQARTSCGVLYEVWDYYVFPNYAIYLARSVDGGTTWEPKYKTVVEPQTKAVKEPCIAIDADDNLHIGWYEQTNATTYHVFYRKFLAATETFESAKVQVSTTASTWTYGAKPVIVIGTVDPRIHFIWNRVNRLIYNHRHDDGSWQGEYQIVLASSPTSFDLAIDGNNILHAAVQNGVSNIRHYYPTTTHPNSSADWTYEDVIVEPTDELEYPKIAIDDGNYVHVVWGLIDRTVYAEGDKGIAYANNRTGAFVKQTLDLPSRTAGENWDHNPHIAINGATILVIFIKNCVSAETSDYGDVWKHSSSDYGASWPSANKKQITNYGTDSNAAAYPTLRWAKNFFNYPSLMDGDWVRYPTAPQTLYNLDIAKA